MKPDRRAERRAALLRRVEQEDLDGLILTHLPNIRYLTGFTGSSAIVLLLQQELVLLTDFRYVTQVGEEVGDFARVEIESSDVWKRFWQVAGEYAGIRTLGFEANHMTVSEAERLAGTESVITRTGVSGLVESLRVQKDPGEIEAVRNAASLASDALRATLLSVKAGQSELEIAALLELALRQRGSEWHPFHTIVASGPRTALPHASTSDRTVQKGDWLLLDFGAQVDGYCADITRTVVVGATATERQSAAYGIVRDAQTQALQGLRAGLTGKEADQLARGVIDDRGFSEAFGHSLGHGLGLEVHEEPRLSRTNEEALPERAVVTVEPGIYIHDWGGVRIEDDVVLTAAGVELLSDGNTELEELH